MGGPANPYIWVGEPVAQQPGGQGQPPRCRATGPRDLRAIIFAKFFAQKPLPPRCRAARSRPPGNWAAGVYSCKFVNRKYLHADPWGRSPGSGAAGPPGRPAAGRPALAARLLDDRLSHPYIRVGWSPHPSFASLKFQKPRKEREGERERGEALPDFRAGDCR